MKLLEVKNLQTSFHTSAGELRAVDGVSFDLEAGECLGLVGESGCGKSTCALSICDLLPTGGEICGGEVLVNGVDYRTLSDKELRARRWKEVSLIFQGAMNAFNPVKRVGWQLAEAMQLHDGLSKKQAMERAGDLFELVGIARERVKQYPHEFSGGMKQRAMIAMALACGANLIIGDEPTTALDVMIQAQILELLEKLRREMKMGMILITHDLSILGETCDRIAVMYAGKIVEIGTVEDIFDRPAHPYTQRLIECFPNVNAERRLPEGIAGYPPNLTAPPAGCRFHPRCRCCVDACDKKEPVMRPLGGRHFVACHIGEGCI